MQLSIAIQYSGENQPTTRYRFSLQPKFLPFSKNQKKIQFTFGKATDRSMVATVIGSSTDKKAWIVIYMLRFLLSHEIIILRPKHIPYLGQNTGFNHQYMIKFSSAFIFPHHLSQAYIVKRPPSGTVRP
jgi:hypothetical protein